MPNLTNTSMELRKSQAVQVYAKVQQGLKLDEALDAVGISKNVYYRWIQECDDALAALHELSQSLERTMLSDMVIAKANIVAKLVSKINADVLDVKELIDVYKLFGVEIDILSARHTVAVQDVVDFLSGPVTRIIPQGANITLKGDGSVDVRPIPQEIIDI